MGKLLAFAIVIYLTIRITRFVLAVFSPKEKESENKGGYFKETEIRDADFTDVEDENE